MLMLLPGWSWLNAGIPPASKSPIKSIFNVRFHKRLTLLIPHEFVSFLVFSNLEATGWIWMQPIHLCFFSQNSLPLSFLSFVSWFSLFWPLCGGLLEARMEWQTCGELPPIVSPSVTRPCGTATSRPGTSRRQNSLFCFNTCQQSGQQESFTSDFLPAESFLGCCWTLWPLTEFKGIKTPILTELMYYTVTVSAKIRKTNHWLHDFHTSST